jgi:asparagine synthase (glutamine-hydrolysing)
MLMTKPLGIPINFESKIQSRSFNADDDTRIIVNGDLLNIQDDASLISLYKSMGPDFITRIDGSFTISIQDPKKLILIRDRCGTKPLFYLKSNNDIVFSSDIKAIVNSPYYPNKRVNLISLNNFLSYGYIPHPETMFEGIRQVKPGHMLTWENGKLEEKPYWKFQYKPTDPIKTEKEYTEAFLEIFEKAVSRCLSKHPDAGAFLSGGLDTSSVVAMMHKLTGKPFKVFTAGFHEKKYNEIEDAKILSDHLNLDHYTTLIDFTNDFPDFLKELVHHHDEPFADTSAIPSYHVARLAREHVATVLTGDFPDQLIGGSGHQVMAMNKELNDPIYKKLLRNRKLNSFIDSLQLKAGSTSLFDKMKRALYRESFPLEEQRVLLNMPVPSQLKHCLYSKDLLDINRKYDPLNIAREIYKEVPNEPLLNKILYFDILSYAPDDLKTKVDRMCSANGLNAISPFHDLELIEFIATIPVTMKIRGSNRKYIMREALRPFLPDHTLNKKKQGFAMPMAEWMVLKMSDFVQDLLFDAKTLNRGYFDKGFLKTMVTNYLNHKTDYATGSEATIISLITLELWHRLFIDG